MVWSSQCDYGGEENKAWQEEADYTQGPRERVTTCLTGENTSVVKRWKIGARRKSRQEPYLGFPWKRQGRAG